MKVQKRSPIEQFVINSVTELRKKRGFSQLKLANLIDVSPGFIGRVESSKYTTKYNLNHLNKLAKALNCSIRSFFPNKSL